MDPQNEDSSNKEKAAQMRSLYDAVPYPAMATERILQPVPLLEHWINSAFGYYNPTLHARANILVAGCGSGAEATMLAKHYPNASIVGLDFSAKSIEHARNSALNQDVNNVTFQVADLCSHSWIQDYEAFDFVLCNAVADYVENVEALLDNLSACMTQKGIMFMTANTPYHPAVRIRKAFREAGITPSSFDDSKEQRRLLRSIVALIGPNIGIASLADAPKSYLDIDIFAPIAHHHSLSEWCSLATEASLYFCGSMGSLDALDQLTDSQLPALYGMDRALLSKWMVEVRQKPGMQMLFSKSSTIKRNFNDFESILKWRPKLDACVGQLPAMQNNPNQPMNLTLQFQGHPGLRIYSSAYDLEVLRQCNGIKSLTEIIETIPTKGDEEGLKASLFRAYQYGILT